MKKYILDLTVRTVERISPKHVLIRLTDDKPLPDDLTVRTVERISPKHVLIRLTDDKPLPEMLPGQFVEVRVDGSSATFLRRPISINFVDCEHNELWLMVAMVGDGTRRLGELKAGDKLNCVLPLGNGFTFNSAGTALHKALCTRRCSLVVV